MFDFRSSYVAATVLTLTTLAACSSKKDDPAAATPTATPLGVTWTVDGSNVTATSIQKATTGNNFEFAGSYTLSSTNSKGVDIILPKAVGTYAVPGTGPTAIQAVYLAISGTPVAYLGTAGTVTVTSLTATNIIGTFSFTAMDTFNGSTATKTITDGKFNIAL